MEMQLTKQRTRAKQKGHLEALALVSLGVRFYHGLHPPFHGATDQNFHFHLFYAVRFACICRPSQMKLVQPSGSPSQVSENGFEILHNFSRGQTLIGKQKFLFSSQRTCFFQQGVLHHLPFVPLDQLRHFFFWESRSFLPWWAHRLHRFRSPSEITWRRHNSLNWSEVAFISSRWTFL